MGSGVQKVTREGRSRRRRRRRGRRGGRRRGRRRGKEREKRNTFVFRRQIAKHSGEEVNASAPKGIRPQFHLPRKCGETAEEAVAYDHPPSIDDA